VKLTIDFEVDGEEPIVFERVQQFVLAGTLLGGPFNRIHVGQKRADANLLLGMTRWIEEELRDIKAGTAETRQIGDPVEQNGRRHD